MGVEVTHRQEHTPAEPGRSSGMQRRLGTRKGLARLPTSLRRRTAGTPAGVVERRAEPQATMAG